MKTYELFYKAHGIRLSAQLPSPPVSSYLNYNFPVTQSFTGLGMNIQTKLVLVKMTKLLKMLKSIFMQETLNTTNS